MVLECVGVGYGLFVSYEDYGVLESGSDAKLYIYEHIRENSHDLFGFRTAAAKSFFEQLLSVNGVGPKMALAILNTGGGTASTPSHSFCDTKFISQASGVGKRVAERVVVDLKDKVGLAADESATDFLDYTCRQS